MLRKDIHVTPDAYGSAAAGQVLGTACDGEPARLWQQQGKTVEAQQMLAEIYGWFTEGFDPAVLQEARRLLEELQ